MTVIAAGFDGGAPPAAKPTARSIGQVVGASEPRTSLPSQVTDEAYAPEVGAPVTPAAPSAPAVPAQPSPAEQEPVPAFLSGRPSPATAPLEVPPVLDEEPARRQDEDLDVPDFLR